MITELLTAGELLDALQEAALTVGIQVL